MPLFPLTAAHLHVRRIHAYIYEEEDTCIYIYMRRRIHAYIYEEEDTCIYIYMRRRIHAYEE
jgi:hypothetical protein